MKILKVFSLILFLINLSDAAISSASSSSGESRRAIKRDMAKEELLSVNLETTADAFNGDPTSSTLKNFLIAVANFSNFSQLDLHKGSGTSKAGVKKHKSCKEIIEGIRGRKGEALLGVDPNKSILITKGRRAGETANFDVVWVNGDHVYGYDFKFGNASISPDQRDKYDIALHQEYSGKIIHDLEAIRPKAR